MAAELHGTLPARPYALAATLTLRDGEFSIAPLEARLGDSDLFGAVRIGRGKQGPDLTASGSSPRTLAAGSDGNILLTLGPGQLNNSVVEAFSGDLLAQLVSALNPFAKTQRHMAFECGIAAATLEDGQALLDPLAIQSEKLQVIAGGSIDLKTEALDIEFNTRPRSGVGVSADMFVTPFVSLEGTLAKPGLGINETSTLLARGAAVATGGLSLLWKGLYDRAAGTIDHCQDTLEKHAHPPLNQE